MEYFYVDSNSSFTELVCDLVYKEYLRSLRLNGEFNVALTGGKTPIHIYDGLKKRYLELINWSRVNFYFIDERCVPKSSKHSNFGVAKEHLLDFIEGYRVYRIQGEIDPGEAAIRYANILEDVDLHLAILGIGEDGHVGSIFPGSPELESNRTVVSTTLRHGGFLRISLSLKRIDAIAFKLLIVNSNEKKLNVLRSGDIDYPINRLSDLHVVVNTTKK